MISDSLGTTHTPPRDKHLLTLLRRFCVSLNSKPAGTLCQNRRPAATLVASKTNAFHRTECPCLITVLKILLSGRGHVQLPGHPHWPMPPGTQIESLRGVRVCLAESGGESLEDVIEPLRGSGGYLGGRAQAALWSTTRTSGHPKIPAYGTPGLSHIVSHIV